MIAPSSSSLEEFAGALASIDRAIDWLAEGHGGPPLLTPYRLLEWLQNSPQAADAVGCAARKQLCSILQNEICELLLPVLLDEGRNLVAFERARNVASSGAASRDERGELLQSKLALLAASSYRRALEERTPPGYGFVTYPAYMLVQPQALIRTCGSRPERAFPWAYPVVYELEGLCEPRTKSPVPGWLVFTFVKPARLTEDVDLVRQKTREGVAAVEKLGGRLAGLGGWLASLTDGGAWLTRQVGIRLTTGHSYTVTNIVNTMLRAVAATGLPLREAVVCVIGAAGSVGSGVARLCATLPIKELILVDHREVTFLLKDLGSQTGLPVRATDLQAGVAAAHAVLSATTASEILFDPQWLREGAIVIDDSHPKNVSRELLARRDDILVLEGGAVQLPPAGYSIHPALGPGLRSFSWQQVNLPVAGPHDVPSCLAEVMLWTLLGQHREQYSIGRADPLLARYLNDQGELCGFQPAQLQCFGESVPASRLERVRRAHQAACVSNGVAR
jgi:predicted amino acid dehydrogenase